MNAGHVSVLTPRHSVDVDALSFAGRGSVDGESVDGGREELL